MSGKNLLMLFAPKFNDFGCDVARAFIARCGGGHVHGLCTGPPEVRDHVATELSEYGGQFLAPRRRGGEVAVDSRVSRRTETA